MKLFKTTVAAIAILAPLVIGSTSALAQERGRWGGRGGGDAPAQAAPQAQQPGRQYTPRGDGGGFRGDRGDRGGFRGGGSDGGGRRFQGGQPQAPQAPAAVLSQPQFQAQQQFQGRNADRGQRNFDNRGGGRADGRFQGGQNFYQGGGDGRVQGRNFDRDNRFDNRGYDGRGYDGRGFDRNDNRYRGDNNRFDNNRFDNNRYRGGGERFSYRGRDFFRFRTTPYSWPRGYSYRAWAPRQILPSLFLSQQYYLDDFYSYGLDQPPYGYEWVRVGQDALLVNLYTGEILDVVPGVFYW